MALAFALLLACLAASVSGQQPFTAGICPTYQTSQFFDATKIGKITQNQGYSVYMLAGSETESSITCQRIRILDGNKYILQYVDGTDNVRRVEGQYIATPSGYINSGSLELRGGDQGVFGADVFGATTLFPLVIGDDIDVYIACTSFGLYYTESLYVMTGYYDQGAQKDQNEVVEFLKNLDVPLSGKLKKADQSCDAYNYVQTL